jgi:hypothetical protein
MPVSTRGGKNHGGAAAAIAALSLWLLVAPTSPLHAQALPPLPASPAAGESPLVQRNVPAEATAENAVVARDRALIAGQRVAYERLASQMGLATGLSDSQIEGLVQSIVIESERVTTNRYTGRITVNFNPARIAGGAAAAAGGAAGQAPGQPGARPGAPAVTTVDAVARYGSFREWLELNRRLKASAQVAGVEVVTISGQMARLRVGLRSDAASAAADMAAGGLALGPAPMGAPPGEGWRLSLAGGR